MELIKNTTAKIKANPISTLLGAVVGFAVVKKVMPNSKWYVLGGIALLGGVAGAMISNQVLSNRSKKMTQQTLTQ